MKTRPMRIRVDDARISEGNGVLVLQQYDGDIVPTKRVTIELDHSTVRYLLVELREWAEYEEREASRTALLFAKGQP